MLIRGARGFTLVELMVTLSVLAIVLAAAVPSFGTWVANARVRTAAEAVLNGLRLAQSESVQRNRQTVFVLTNATPGLTATPAANGSNWYVRALPLTGEDDSTFYVKGDSLASHSGVTIVGAAQVCFNSAGRMVANARSYTGFTANCIATAAQTFNVTRTGADRPLRVYVYPGGRIRMCDPAKTLASGQPDGC